MTGIVRYPRPEVLDDIRLDRPTVIEASAGTGKTYTLEHLVVELLVRGAASIEEILIVTFTEKATREMRQRIRRTLGALLHARPGDPGLAAEGESAWAVDDEARRRLRDAWMRFDRAPISTIHGFCQRVLGEHAFDSGGLFAQELVDARSLFERSLRAEVREGLAEGDPLRDVLERCFGAGDTSRLESDLFAWFQERGRPMPDPPDPEAPFGRLVHELLPRVRARLAALKRRSGQLDFDDLLLRLHEALHGPGGDALAARLRAAYRCCLVDEFQDTDEVQWDIFRRLFLTGDGRHGLFVIGDPKQAIYGFRGGDIHTYLAARDALAERGARVPLLANYRSTERAVAAQNVIFGGGFFQGDIQYEPVRCGRPGPVLENDRGQEVPPVVLVQVVDRRPLRADGIRSAFAGFVAREIQRVVRGEALRHGEPGALRPVRYSDVHVLTRSGREALEVGDALRRHGVPHAFFKQEGLFQTAEARHVRDVLRAVADPGDRARRLRAWLTPFFGVPLADLSRVRDADETHPLVARLHHWKALADAHDHPALFRDLLEGSGLVRREAFFEESERALTNYLHLCELLLAETHRRRRGLPELVAHLSALIDRRAAQAGEDANVQRLESERDAVQILTMHKAKGLEAKVVFVAGGFTARPGDGNAPRVCHRDGAREAWLGKAPDEVEARIQQEAREEDERLLYVAVTRAAARLYLPYLGPPASDRDGSPLEHTFSRMNGCYRILNDRLVALVGQDAAPPELFARTRVWVGGDGAAEAEEAHDGGRAPWSPPEALLEPPPDPGEALAGLRTRRAGPVVTSYTRLKAGHGGYVAPEAEGESFTGEAFDLAPAETERGGLPGGSAVGVFLHEVLEELELAAVREAAEAKAWSQREEVAALFRVAARRNGVAAVHVPEAQRLVFEALRAPVEAGALRLPAGLCSLDRRVAEMSFHYPVPEEAHPRLDEPRPAPDGWPFRVGRGYVRGVVDLVFEHDGRVYFLDWKSDRLPSWSEDAIARHVERNYALQAKLYALGVLRLLDVRDRAAYDARFGGLLYCFLRGMGEPGAGVHFERPGWDAVREWEETLRSAEAPFGYRIGPGEGR
ncbi:MAG: UvrD-helicase domain-containing protein [Myxococcota bacterium]